MFSAKKTISAIALFSTTAFSLGALAQEGGSSPAGLFLEPALTYEVGNTTTNYPSPLSDATGKVQGFGLGARIGFHISEIVFAGVDGRYSMPKFTDSSVNYDASATSTNWGPVVGVQMPVIGIRAWGSYILGGNLNPEKSNGFDVNFKDTSGFRLGAGFRVLMLSVNLEYQQLEYGKTILESVGPFATDTTLDSVKMKNKTWIASVSLPLEM